MLLVILFIIHYLHNYIKVHFIFQPTASPVVTSTTATPSSNVTTVTSSSSTTAPKSPTTSVSAPAPPKTTSPSISTVALPLQSPGMQSQTQVFAQFHTQPINKKCI